MSLRRLLSRHLLQPYGGALLAVLVFQALQAAATLSLPTINARLIDDGVLAGDNDTIRSMGALMLVFTLLQVVFAVSAVRVGARAAMGFGRDVRSDLFHRVTGYSAREVGRFGAPSLITRITNDVQQVQQLVVLGATMMLSAPLMMTIGLVLAVTSDTGLSKVFAVAIPVTVVVLGTVVSRMVPAFQQMQFRIDRMNTVLREQITGLRVVRAFVREPEETARFERTNADVTEVALRSGRMMSMMFPTVGLIMNTTSVAMIWFGAGRVDSGAIQVGTLVAFLTYTIQILMGVVMATFMISMIPRAGVAAERIVEVLETSSTVTAPVDPVSDPPERGTVEFRDVSFRYPGAGRAVLRNVSFRVEPGATLAVIGATGSGKTTMVNLVARLFDATEGTVLVDGVDVRRLDARRLWGSIGYVPQRAYLFSGTVASNLRFGRPDATDAELWAALEVAQAAGFVQAMPDGLESEITQGGTNVSGGQRQRLCIARALVANPSLFLFDDAFSALDVATDARLRDALTPHLAEAAMVVVAQRVATIRDADEIIVLEGGEVVGRGTHDQLVVGCPTYAEIVRSQHVEEVVS
ncbi:MAG: ABC transporter ATP-binding protein [Acidimicrobiales bacterium]